LIPRVKIHTLLISFIVCSIHTTWSCASGHFIRITRENVNEVITVKVLQFVWLDGLLGPIAD